MSEAWNTEGSKRSNSDHVVNMNLLMESFNAVKGRKKGKFLYLVTFIAGFLASRFRFSSFKQRLCQIHRRSTRESHSGGSIAFLGIIHSQRHSFRFRTLPLSGQYGAQDLFGLRRPHRRHICFHSRQSREIRSSRK